MNKEFIRRIGEQLTLALAFGNLVWQQEADVLLHHMQVFGGLTNDEVNKLDNYAKTFTKGEFKEGFSIDLYLSELTYIESLIKTGGRPFVYHLLYPTCLTLQQQQQLEIHRMRWVGHPLMQIVPYDFNAMDDAFAEYREVKFDE